MKKIVSVILAVILCSSLSACAPGNENSKIISNVESSSPSENSATESKAEDSRPEKQTATVGQKVTGDKWSISLLSAKTFTEIGDDFLSTKPEDGKIFLVLFFEVENVSDKDDYFNYFYIESYVDGYNESIKIILGDADGYETLTGNVAAGKKLKGYLAWEVPTDWKELEVSYKDGVWTSDKAATFIVTPENLG